MLYVSAANLIWCYVDFLPVDDAVMAMIGAKGNSASGIVSIISIFILILEICGTAPIVR
ncbi:MAG: hypothetical protein OXU24_07915 [Gammaproteobacteria bacterium]|nr:hypothetical protein [Gammaproteobacteria bacterium]